MSLEALWTIEFQDVHGWVNGGVVVFETNRVFGGDSNYYYVGQFEQTKYGLTADARIVHYHGEARTAFGDDAKDFTVSIQGTYLQVAKGEQRSEDIIMGKMRRTDSPQQELVIRLTRRADLP